MSTNTVSRVLVAPIAPLVALKPDFTALFLANHTRHISSEHGIHVFHVPSKSAAGGHYRVRLSPHGNHCDCPARVSPCSHMIAGQTVLERLQKLQLLQAELYGLNYDLQVLRVVENDPIGHKCDLEKLREQIAERETEIEDCDGRIKAHIRRRAYVSNPATGVFSIWLEGEETPYTVTNSADGAETCSCAQTGCIHRQIADMELAQSGAKFLCDETRQLVYKRFYRFEFENGLDIVGMGEEPITRKSIEKYLKERNGTSSPHND